MQANYITKAWNDAASLIACLNVNIWANKDIRVRQRRVITIENYDSCLAYYNYTFTKLMPYRLAKTPCTRLPAEV